MGLFLKYENFCSSVACVRSKECSLAFTSFNIFFSFKYNTHDWWLVFKKVFTSKTKTIVYWVDSTLLLHTNILFDMYAYILIRLCFKIKSNLSYIIKSSTKFWEHPWNFSWGDYCWLWIPSIFECQGQYRPKGKSESHFHFHETKRFKVVLFGGGNQALDRTGDELQ